MIKYLNGDIETLNEFLTFYDIDASHKYESWQKTVQEFRSRFQLPMAIQIHKSS